ARPTHQYLGFGAGTDFDRRIVVKTNVAERLGQAFERSTWRGETVVFSGNTDCYQPVEARYGLTRACLEQCFAYRNPVSIITKSKLVVRDAALLAQLATQARCHVTVSLPFLDAKMARAIEPNAASPKARLATIAHLADAGVPVGISVGPIVPGLSEDQIPAILRAAKEAGASWAFGILLRLPAEVRPVFEDRLREAYPLRAKKVMSAVREMRGGRTNDPRFGSRMKGQGARWDAIAQLFEHHRRNLGLDLRVAGAAHEGPTTFERNVRQLRLFA
ncbi:MAG: radical SAM protein, partial [Myxococcota bacterium]